MGWLVVMNSNMIAKRPFYNVQAFCHICIDFDGLASVLSKHTHRSAIDAN